ncbi:hypothetical protein [Bradyrhizobium diazoefficiens]|uniref:hypothetical protein n=1 Tax=Bradyrhizobium diazoefficiens TaxID=1355477 RepID=UPI001FF07C4D|nr:hypothetical protein [Bradyrhizobium diazoefficiens]
MRRLIYREIKMALGAFDACHNVGRPAGGGCHEIGDRLDRGLNVTSLGLGRQGKRRVMAGEQAGMRVV